MKQISFLFLIVIAAVACNKTPSAAFSMNKSEYKAGETVELKNESKNAKTYEWTLPDGQTSKSENVNYVLSNSTGPGTYKIKLKAISKKGDKSGEVTKEYNVN